MVNEWRQFSLSELADLSGGFAFKSKDYTESGRFVLRTLNIRDDGSISRENAVYLPLTLCHQYSRFELRPYDTLFVMVGATLGKIGFVRESDLPALLNQNMWLIRAKNKKSDPRFIHYAFRYAVTKSLGWASGSARDFVRRDDYRNIIISAPVDIREQQAIACILGALDDKIELNRRMNRTLEDMARAIFKSWFVDFDPVRAKAVGQQPPGLKPEIADLFPDSFEDSELGEIPKGWQIRPIGDVVRVLGGGTPRTKEPIFWDGGTHPFCTPKDMSALTEPVLLHTERHLTDEGVAKVSSGQLPIGTVLLSSRAPIGYLAIAEVPVSVNQGIIAMVCDGDLPNQYVLHWTKANMDRVLANANGSTFMEISKRNFRPITVIIPSLQILRNFKEIIDPLYHRVVSSLKEVQKIAALRDTLLPKLISGELRVPDAERIAGRCL